MPDSKPVIAISISYRGLWIRVLPGIQRLWWQVSVTGLWGARLPFSFTGSLPVLCFCQLCAFAQSLECLWSMGSVDWAQEEAELGLLGECTCVLRAVARENDGGGNLPCAALIFILCTSFPLMFKGVQPLLDTLGQDSHVSVAFLLPGGVCADTGRTGDWCFNPCLHPPCACNMTVLLKVISSDRKHAPRVSLT